MARKLPKLNIGKKTKIEKSKYKNQQNIKHKQVASDNNFKLNKANKETIEKAKNLFGKNDNQVFEQVKAAQQATEEHLSAIKTNVKVPTKNEINSLYEKLGNKEITKSEFIKQANKLGFYDTKEVKQFVELQSKLLTEMIELKTGKRTKLSEGVLPSPAQTKKVDEIINKNLHKTLSMEEVENFALKDGWIKNASNKQFEEIVKKPLLEKAAKEQIKQQQKIIENLDLMKKVEKEKELHAFSKISETPKELLSEDAKEELQWVKQNKKLYDKLEKELIERIKYGNITFDKTNDIVKQIMAEKKWKVLTPKRKLELLKELGENIKTLVASTVGGLVQLGLAEAVFDTHRLNYEFKTPDEKYKYDRMETGFQLIEGVKEWLNTAYNAGLDERDLDTGSEKSQRQIDEYIMNYFGGSRETYYNYIRNR